MLAAGILAGIWVCLLFLLRTKYNPGWEYGNGFLTVFEEKFTPDFYPPVDLAVGDKQKWRIIWFHMGPGDGSGPLVVEDYAYFRGTVEVAKNDFRSKLFVAKNDGMVFDISHRYFPPGVASPQVWFGRDSIQITYYASSTDPRHSRGRNVTNSIPYVGLRDDVTSIGHDFEPATDGKNHWMGPKEPTLR